MKKSLKKQSECVFSGWWSLDRCFWCGISTTNIFIISTWKWVLLCREWNSNWWVRTALLKYQNWKGVGGDIFSQALHIRCFFAKSWGKFAIHVNPGLEDSLGPTSCTTVWQQSRQWDYGCIVVKCASTTAEHLSKKVLWCLSEVTVSL